MGDWKRDIETRISIRSLCEVFKIRPTTDNGVAIRAPCPIHHGDNPSGFTLTYNERGRHVRWICSSGNCGHGDLVSLVMAIQNCRFNDAVQFLCDLAGTSVKDISGMFKQASDESFHYDDVRKFNDAMREFKCDRDKPKPEYVSPFICEEFVQECIKRRNQYFTRRGFPDEVQAQFEVGFVPLHLSPWRKNQFPARVTIPLRDESGALVGISGRIIRECSNANDKYNILPGSRRGEILYGLNLTSKYIKQADEVVIVEGFADMWRCWQHGVRNVVALMSKDTSWEQFRMILSIANRFIVAVDNDKFGKKGGDKIERRLRDMGTVTRLMPPRDRDIGSLEKDEFDILFKNVRRAT